MSLRRILLAGIAVAMAGCSGNEVSQETAVNNVGTNAEASKKRPTYCFFKDAETKGWAAKRDGSGNVMVSGKAHVKDARYKAVISEHGISGDRATLWLTINENGGYAAPENWWDVSTTLPDSSSVTEITLLCGKKAVAKLSLAK